MIRPIYTEICGFAYAMKQGNKQRKYNICLREALTLRGGSVTAMASIGPQLLRLQRIIQLDLFGTWEILLVHLRWMTVGFEG